MSILNRLNRLNDPNISYDPGCPFGGDVSRTDILNLTSSDGCANSTEVVSTHRRRGASGSGGSSAGLLPEKYALGGGTIEWPKATSRGAKRRAGRGSGAVTLGKILKFETQFGAIWCILATNWR